MPLPPELHAKVVMGSGVISRGRLLAGLTIAAIFILSGNHGLDVPPVSAQIDITDDELERISAGRLVRVGSFTNGRPIATLPIEVYISQVLSGEADPKAPDAAQQSLAVAIRTYTIVNLGRHRADGYDLCDSTHCQVFRAATPVTRRATLETAGRILTYNGVPSPIFYSANCGGRSEAAIDVWPDANYPYLQSVEDDVHGEDEEWRLERTLSEVQRALERVGFNGRLSDLSIAARSGSGRVARVRLTGLAPDEIAGDALRAALGTRELRSTAFSLEREGDRLLFTGRGWGHGVGMCAVGSGRRAARGESMEAILGHYFPGLQIVRFDGVSARLSPASAPTVKRVSARVPRGSTLTASDLERMSERAYESLSTRLGVSVGSISVQLHQSVEEFRQSTGQPWWASAYAQGTKVELTAAPVLSQRDGIDVALRRAIAELMVAPVFNDHPAWVRVGAARYFARSESAVASESRTRCPLDIELIRAVSAVAQREAEARAEACFARAMAETGDWRTIR